MAWLIWCNLIARFNGCIRFWNFSKNRFSENHAIQHLYQKFNISPGKQSKSNVYEQMNETTNVDFIKQLFNFFWHKIELHCFHEKVHIYDLRDSMERFSFIFHISSPYFFLWLQLDRKFLHFKYQIISWKQTRFSFNFKSSDCIVVSFVLHAFQQIRILFPMPFRLHGIFSINSSTTEIICRTFVF